VVANSQSVAPGNEITGGGKAKAVDLFVDGGIFFDVDVSLRNVRFGLIVIVIGDEIGDGVIGKEGFALAM
jgi:hypothetical protein